MKPFYSKLYLATFENEHLILAYWCSCCLFVAVVIFNNGASAYCSVLVLKVPLALLSLREHFHPAALPSRVLSDRFCE